MNSSRPLLKALTESAFITSLGRAFPNLTALNVKTTHTASNQSSVPLIERGDLWCADRFYGKKEQHVVRCFKRWEFCWGYAKKVLSVTLSQQNLETFMVRVLSFSRGHAFGSAPELPHGFTAVLPRALNSLAETTL
ncbi:hypothetical protein XENTR_v10009320 [Xenopus tropicalis]|nr:hypothetical protein XENTR_v10009320 [Xenopus tropicalis]